MNSERTVPLQASLDMLIVKSLVAGEMHGLGISRRIQQVTGGTFVVKLGSLFPALRRMEEEGWISSFWGHSENNRRAKYYNLTKAGRKPAGNRDEAMGPHLLGDRSSSKSL